MPRSLRHLAAATLAVAALSVAAVPAFAADAPVLTGTVVDASGQPFPVEDGMMTMTAPDGGGIHGAPVSVGGNGSFEVELMPWGTEATPAEVTISITGVVSETVETPTGCIDQYAPVAETTFAVALQSGGEPEPVELVAEQQLIGTVCGAGSSPTTTLPPSEVDPGTPQPSEAPAVVAPATPVPSEPPVAVPVAAADSGPSPVLLGALAAGAVALVVIGAWLGLARRPRT